MAETKRFLHALRCLDAASAAAERSAQKRAWADTAACRAIEIRVLTDERLALSKERWAHTVRPLKPATGFSLI